MTNFTLVFLGGGLGAVLRYSMALLFRSFTASNLWISTLVVNITGSLFFIFLYRFHQDLSPNVQVFLKIGLLGGLTTFSSLSFEVFQLFTSGLYVKAVSVLLLNIVLGIVIGILVFR